MKKCRQKKSDYEEGINSNMTLGRKKNLNVSCTDAS